MGHCYEGFSALGILAEIYLKTNGSLEFSEIYGDEASVPPTWGNNGIKMDLEQMTGLIPSTFQVVFILGIMAFVSFLLIDRLYKPVSYTHLPYTYTTNLSSASMNVSFACGTLQDVSL